MIFIYLYVQDGKYIRAEHLCEEIALEYCEYDAIRQALGTLQNMGVFGEWEALDERGRRVETGFLRSEATI